MNQQERTSIICHWIGEFASFKWYLLFSHKELVEILHPALVTPAEPNMAAVAEWTDADHRALVHSTDFSACFADMICIPEMWQWVKAMELTGDRQTDVCNMLIRIGEALRSLNFYSDELTTYLERGGFKEDGTMRFCTIKDFLYGLKVDPHLASWYQTIGEHDVNDVGMLVVALLSGDIPAEQTGETP